MNDFNPTPEFEEKVRQAMNVPNANPEFVDTLRNELAKRPARMKSRSVFRPAWALAFVLALAVLLMIVPGVAAAIGRLFGYVPNVGLVENTGDLRMLAEPISQTRDGVTLTISYVLVDQTHVEVIYDAQGIPAENDSNQAADAMTNPRAFCGGVVVGDTYNKEGDPILKLPDGMSLDRDLTTKYPQNVFAMKPVYEAQVPADVMELTFTLKCIPNARLGAVPENWELPIQLKVLPADTAVGNPVIEVEQTAAMSTVEPSASSTTETPALPVPRVTMKLEKVVPLDTGYVFYISFDMENKDPSLISILPTNVYLLDSQGTKLYLMADYTWQPFEHPVGSTLGFATQSKPTEGPMTLVVEDAVATYAPLYTDPPQSTPEQMTFTFNVGENPQYNQTWVLDEEFQIAGYPIRITSARAAKYDDIKTPDDLFGSQGFEYGYDFTVETDPSIKIQVEMQIMSDSADCYLTNAISIRPESSGFHYVQLCRDAYPKGDVRVQIWQLSVLVENTWQVTWTP
jgi:hypothetical protein